MDNISPISFEDTFLHFNLHTLRNDEHIRDLYLMVNQPLTEYLFLFPLFVGEIFPAAFSDRGPDIEARSANLYSRGKGVEIYDCKKGILKIGPFAYKILPNIDILLAQDDQFLLMFSTSPQVEPPHFIPHVRSTLKFMKDNPHPYETVFKNGQPHYFKRNEDCNAWVHVHL